MGNDLQVWLHPERHLTSEERQWLDKLLSRDFPGREVLRDQVKAARVTGFCNCGCGSINLKVPTSIPPYPYAGRIPVEMQVQEPPVLFLLHVLNGYVDELELVWGDSPVSDCSIQVDTASVTVNFPPT